MSKSKEYPTVEKFLWPEAKGCFLVLSCRKTDKNCNKVQPAVSFLCVLGDVAAEWEPTNGSIQLWFRGDYEEHYAFPRIQQSGWDWSQIAVENEGLPRLANSGDYAAVFKVLRKWADRTLPAGVSNE